MRLWMVLTFLAGTAAADPVEGVWQTQPGDDGRFGMVRISPCGTAFCGTLERGYDAAGRQAPSDRIGMRLVEGMTPQGGGAYGGGTIYAPDRDKTYRSKMQLEGDRLKVSGCVGPICRSQTWVRVE